MQEDKSQTKKTTSPRNAWLTPVQRCVLSGLHNYPEVEHADFPLAPEDPKVVPQRCFFPTRKDLTMKEVEGIKSTKQYAHWPTFAPQSFLAVVAESVVMRAAAKEGRWHQVNNSWLAYLLGVSMLVRPVGSKAWTLSLGTVGGTAGRAMAVEEVALAGTRYFTIPDSTTVQWLPVVDESLLEAALIKWMSPLHLFVKHKGLESMLIKKGSSYFTLASDPQPLLKAAAANAFHALPEPALIELASYLGIQATGALFEKLWALVRHELSELADHAVLDILAKRIAPDSSYTHSFFSAPLVKEADGEQDGAVLEGHIKSKAIVQECFNGGFAAKCKAVRSGAGLASSSGRGRGRGRGRGASAQVHAREAPQLTSHEFSLDDARSWLPPARRALPKDLPDGRWLIVVSGPGSRSRSFQLYGERKALAMVLKFAWDGIGTLLGQSCPHQWILDEGEDIQ